MVLESIAFVLESGSVEQGDIERGARHVRFISSCRGSDGSNSHGAAAFSRH